MMHLTAVAFQDTIFHNRKSIIDDAVGRRLPHDEAANYVIVLWIDCLLDIRLCLLF